MITEISHQGSYNPLRHFHGGNHLQVLENLSRGVSQTPPHYLLILWQNIHPCGEYTVYIWWVQLCYLVEQNLQSFRQVRIHS